MSLTPRLLKMPVLCHNEKSVNLLAHTPCSTVDRDKSILLPFKTYSVVGLWCGGIRGRADTSEGSCFCDFPGKMGRALVLRWAHCPEAVRFRSRLTARVEDLAWRKSCGPPLFIFVFTGLPKVGPGDGEFKYLDLLGWVGKSCLFWRRNL